MFVREEAPRTALPIVFGVPMVAEFKSHVLSRDEKGFMVIPFKRLLLAGVGGGLIYTFAKVAASDWSIPLAIAARTVKKPRPAMFGCYAAR